MPPRRPRDRSPSRRIMPPSDRSSRSRQRDMDTHRPSMPSSSRASSRAKESSSSRPRDSRSSKSSQHRETRRGGDDQARTQTHHRQRSSASGSRGKTRRSDHAPPVVRSPVGASNRSPSRSSRRRRSVSTTISSPANDDQQKKNAQSTTRSSPTNNKQQRKMSTKGHNNVNKILSRISKGRSRSRDLRRSKQDIDPWSKDDTGISCSMMNSSSASILATKSSSGSSCPGRSTKSSPTLTTKSIAGSVTTSRTIHSRPPPPPPPQRSKQQHFLPVKHKSASTSAPGISVENNGNAMSSSQPARPAVVRSKSHEGSSSVGSSPYPRGVADPTTVKVPPPANSTRVRSHNDLSSSSNSLLFRKSRPPPPPRRATMSSNNNNNTDGSIPTSSAIIHAPPPRRASMLLSSNNNNNTDGSISTSSAIIPAPPPKRASMSSNNNNNANGSIPTISAIIPAPPPRRASMSSNNNNNANGSIQKGSAIIPVTTNNTIVPATAIPIMFTNNKQPTKHRSSRISKKTNPVSSIEYTDPYGDPGIYSGEVDDTSRPHGKGKMKYDNGIFYEGNWKHGYKDESQGNSSGGQYATNVTRERIMSGFTSWKGQKKKDGDSGDRGTFVYGMEWADYVGMSGKYTGHVNADEIPDGNGVMRYEFGLVAEGNWIKGKLNDGGGGGMSNGVMAQSVAGGMSVAPGGMSVSGGAASVVSGLSMMSIGGTGGGGMMMGGYPQNIMGHNGMMMGGYPHHLGHYQMNTIMPAASPAAAAYYNPAGTMTGGSPATFSYQQQQQHDIMNHPAAPAGGDAYVPTKIYPC